MQNAFNLSKKAYLLIRTHRMLANSNHIDFLYRARNVAPRGSSSGYGGVPLMIWFSNI